MENNYPYYAVCCFGRPSLGRRRSFYRSLASAINDAKELQGGSLTNVRILGYQTRARALDADISDNAPVVWSK
ncbi:MAG: hypothetical protein GF334_10405 [Candidatus Altiarchaeales archaeon]|nr:hypothetical protein [Candidatus Altiarchaeales archaeon]